MAATCSRRLLFISLNFRIRRSVPSTILPFTCNNHLNLFGFSSSLLHSRLNKTPLSPKLLQFRSCSSSVAVENFTTENGEDAVSHPWSEWVSFINRLKSKGYFEEGSLSVEDDGNSGVTLDISDESSLSGYTKMELNRLRNGCLTFARDRFDIFKLLSKEDIQSVVEIGCPSLFRKVVNSGKRLRAFVRLDEGDVCSACNLRGSCDRAYVILRESDSHARTVDIMRMLLIYALDPLVLSGGEKPPGRENVETSARKLLSQLIELSDTAPDPALPKPAVKPPSQKEHSKKFMDRQEPQNVEMKRGDWICQKCNFLNFARNVRCLQCKDDGPKRVSYDKVEVEMKKGDWNCPKCNFMNFARNTNCFRCEESRPKRQLNPGEWECPSCDFLNYRKNMVCLKCNCDRPKDEKLQYEDHIWRKPRSRDM